MLSKEVYMATKALEKGEYLCVIRLKSDPAELTQINKIIENILHGNIQRSEYIIGYFHNNGDKRDFSKLLNENRYSSKHFEKNKGYIEEVTFDKFISSPARKILLEINIRSGNEIELQYLLLQLHQLRSKYLDEKFVVFILSNTYDKENGIYDFLDTSDYFRIRTLLFFYSPSLGLDAQNICDDLLIGYNYTSKNTTKIAVHKIFASDKKLVFNGSFKRIMPIIPINKESYQVLTAQIYSESNEQIKPWISTLERVVSGFKSLTQNIINRVDSANEVEKIIKTDIYLEKLIFYSTLYFIYDENNQLNINELLLLHEICVDYAQGVAQLIENAYLHAVKQVGGMQPCGVANFTIRIRKKEDAEGLYLNSCEQMDGYPFKNVAFFMELYVTDLQFEDFQNIKDKFLLNARSRYNNRGKTESGIVLTKLQESLNLKNLFTGRGFYLEKYLSDPLNVAYHYGLQILNNVIAVADGYLYVKSGNKIEDEYSLLNNYYKQQSIDWQNGTAYVIYLPIKFNKQIDYHDTVAVINETLSSEYDTKEITLDWNDLQQCNTVSLDESRKELYINKIKDCLKNEFDGRDRTIFYIDCSKCPNSLFEPLAKAIFLCMALSDSHIKHIAIINIRNRYEVVKLFRQFALFYNREGKNNSMKGKSVFIVDKEAELDILLCGNIDTIVENMYYGQINGGLDGRTIEIMKHLGNRGQKNGY